MGNIEFSYENQQLSPAHAVISAARTTRTNRDCVAISIVETMEAKYRLLWATAHRSPFPYSLSSQHLYDNCTSVCDAFDMEACLNQLKVNGITTESYYPVKDDGYLTNINLKQVPSFWISHWEPVTIDKNIMCSLIFAGGPLIGGLYMNEDYKTSVNGVYNADGPGSWMGLTFNSELERSYHAVSIVGYGEINGTTCFRILDSAGPRVGQGGIRWAGVGAFYKVWDISVGFDTVKNVVN